MAEIRTRRLLLRPARADDLAALHPIFADARAMLHWSTPPHAALDETRAWLDATMAIDPAEGEDFIVELDGRVIGKAGLYRFPEIGFLFAPAVWGLGVASEAVAAVIARGFGEHKLAAIVADVDPRNAASLRLLARAGFVETGRRTRTWLVGGEWCDSVDLRLTREGWRPSP